MKHLARLDRILWLAPLMVLSGCGGSGDWDAHLPDYDYIEYDELSLGELVGLAMTEEASMSLVDRARVHIPQNKPLKISGTDLSQCGGTPYRYTALNDDQGLHINLRVFLKFQDEISSSRKSTILSELAICEQRSRETWSKAGLAVKVEFVNSASNSDAEVAVIDKKDRSDSKTYYVGGNGLKISDFYCGTYAHEVGHLLGLPDEYSESGTCRSDLYAGRSDDFPHSMMHRHGDAKRSRFAIRHVRQIVDQIHRTAAEQPGPVMIVGKLQQEIPDFDYGLAKVASVDQANRDCSLQWSSFEKLKRGELAVRANVNWFSFRSVDEFDDISKASVKIQRLAVKTTNPGSGFNFFLMDCRNDSDVNVADYRKLLEASGLQLKKVSSPLGEAVGWEKSLWESRGPSDPQWLGHLLNWGS